METRTEYGILWTDVEWDDEVEVRENKEDAVSTIRQFRSWGGKLVTRTIIVGDWTEDV